MLRRFAFALLALWALPAFADMDYHCLSDCKNDGGSTPQCMTQCTYAPPLAKTDAAKPDGTTHKEFVAPVPVGSQVVVTPMVQMPVGSSLTTNFSCVQACMKQNLQSSLCQERCTVAHQ